METHFEIGQQVRIDTDDALGGKVGTVEQVQRGSKDIGVPLVWVRVPGFTNRLPFGVGELEVIEAQEESAE